MNGEFHKPVASALDSTRVDVNVAEAGAASVTDLISRVQNLTLTVHTPAKIIINERTGTIVLGGDVKLTPVSVIHGNLSIEVVTTYTPVAVTSSAPPGFGGEGQQQGGGRGGEGRRGGEQNGQGDRGQGGQNDQDQAAQQGQFNQGGPGGPGFGGGYPGQTALVPQTSVNASDSLAQTMRLDEGANVEELVNGLHAIGTTARDVVAILQAIQAEGGLQAELEVQ